MYCEVAKKSGLILVIGPSNAWINLPGLFLPNSCKIVNDLNPQQITEGNLGPNIDMAWKSIAAFHFGDNPGRNDPTKGKINCKNGCKHIHRKRYDGVLGCEHGKCFKEKKEKLLLQRLTWRYICSDIQLLIEMTSAKMLTFLLLPL